MNMILEKDYRNCLAYIKTYWVKITSYVPRDEGIVMALPHKFISPSEGIFKDDQFYWDSYFIILGLVVSGKRNLAKGMVDNFLYLFDKYRIIPSRNRLYNLGISQPPFLTSMILEVYDDDKHWLRKAAQTAEQELKNYWMDKQHNYFNNGLSRYCDHFWTHNTAEHESGWDMTSRFNELCLDYIPVDLNCCLYKYETDLAKIYSLLGDRKKSNTYARNAALRRKKIMKFHWNEKKEFFFDYYVPAKKQSNFYSLAGFYPLWAGVITKEQAQKMVKALKRFEYKGGLANTQKEHLSKIFKQWDWPNGWANQQYIVIKGLLTYGYNDIAERLAKKWLDLNKKIFMKTNKFWEKYNVVTCNIGKKERYPSQTGFGWTNAVFVRLVKEFSTKKAPT